MKKVLLALAVIAAPGIERALANDFPTQARVEFVLACMNLGGGQSYDTLYPCVCMVDRIASQISYEDYTTAETLSFLYSTPGERGGIFRDAAPEARSRIEQFQTLHEEAEATCFVSQKGAGVDEPS
jgi:aminopeptidase-like protein